MFLRGGRLIVVTALAVTIASFTAPVTPATADPAPAVSTRDRVAQLEQQASEIGEDYDSALDALDAGKRRLTLLRADIAAQQKKVNALSATAQTIALAQFRDRDMGTTVQIFTSQNPDEMLDRLSTANQIDKRMADMLSEQEIQQAALSDMERSAKAEVDALAAQENKLKDLRGQVDSKLSEADRLAGGLSDADRKAMAGDDDSADPGDYAGGSGRAKTAIAFALAQVGKAYVWGADGPNSFDCSGLMMAAYRKIGVSLPHSSRTQATLGHSVSKSNLAPGDLVFFAHGGRIYHVAMYIGNGKIVHARQPRYGIQVNKLATYSAVYSARRIVG